MSHETSADRVAVWFAVVVALIGYGLVWAGFKPFVFRGVKADFSCFYRAGRMVVAGDGPRVYDLRAQSQYDQRLGTQFVDAAGHSFSLPFAFPPYTLAPFALLSHLPYRRAELVWYLANVTMLLALPFVLQTKLGWGNGGTAMALLAPVFFIPAVLALMQGQPSILMLLLLAIAFRQLAGGKLARAGLTLACLTIKPQFVLPMLLALVCWRKWRTLAAFACTGAVLIAISAAIVGWHATLHYPAAVMEFNRLESSLGGEHPASMPNLRGFTYVLVGTRISGVWLERTTIVLSILLLLMMVVSLKRFPTVSEASYSLVIVVTLLVSYHAYLHDTSLLLVPFLLMAKPMGQLPCSATHCSMAGVIVSLYAVPLLPTSLSTTALQMFAVVLMLAAILCLEVKGSDRRSTPSLRNAGLASTHA